MQMEVPGAKVLYSSATGASEPNNLAYMTRLGSCGYSSMTQLVGQLNSWVLSSAHHPLVFLALCKFICMRRWNSAKAVHNIAPNLAYCSGEWLWCTYYNPAYLPGDIQFVEIVIVLILQEMCCCSSLEWWSWAISIGPFTISVLMWILYLCETCFANESHAVQVWSRLSWDVFYGTQSNWMLPKQAS